MIKLVFGIFVSLIGLSCNAYGYTYGTKEIFSNFQKVMVKTPSGFYYKGVSNNKECTISSDLSMTRWYYNNELISVFPANYVVEHTPWILNIDGYNRIVDLFHWEKSPGKMENLALILEMSYSRKANSAELIGIQNLKTEKKLYLCYVK